MIRIETFVGTARRPHIAALGRLRIEVFRAWPYLYDGTPADERAEAAAVEGGARAALIVAFDGGDAVGCATCMPLTDETPNVVGAFAAAGHDPGRMVFYAESVLLAAYRGQGIGVAFFAAREAHARTIPGAALAAFCAVRRSPDDPRRPADAASLTDFWAHRGFVPLPGVVVPMRWKETDSDGLVDNSLDGWGKAL